MEQSLQVFKQLPETKAEIEAFSNSVIESINDGNGDPVKLSAQLKALEETVKAIRKGIADTALDEIEKYGKTHEIGTAKFEIAMTGVSYKYDKCNDKEWNMLNDGVKTIEAKRKEREAFLKTLKNSITIADEDTGEISTIYPPQKTGKESIKITLK